MGEIKWTIHWGGVVNSKMIKDHKLAIFKPSLRDSSEITSLCYGQESQPKDMGEDRGQWKSEIVRFYIIGGGAALQNDIL